MISGSELRGVVECEGYTYDVGGCIGVHLERVCVVQRRRGEGF